MEDRTKGEREASVNVVYFRGVLQGGGDDPAGRARRGNPKELLLLCFVVSSVRLEAGSPGVREAIRTGRRLREKGEGVGCTEKLG